MPTLKARYVHNSRQGFWCDWCNHRIRLNSGYIYLYGMAHSNEKPYAIRFHVECVSSCGDEKIRQALKKAGVNEVA